MAKQVKTPAAPVAPAVAPQLPAALPAGIPSRAGRAKAAPFDGKAAHMPPDVVVPVIPAGTKIGPLDAVGLILSVQPDGLYLSRRQIAQLMIDIGVSNPNNPVGAAHTAGCQTGPQGAQDRGIICREGAASDGQRGYALDKAASERHFIASLKADATGACLPWGEQPKHCRYVGAHGFPWQIVTQEAKALGVKGRDMSQFVPAPVAPPAKTPAKQGGKKK